MIDSKQAFQFAKQQATGILGEKPFRLEEIERDTYKGREVWRVTLGYVQDQTLGGASVVSELRALGFGPIEYKLFLIDATNGDLVAMKLREPLPQ
jgi:hypothetical protein